MKLHRFFLFKNMTIFSITVLFFCAPAVLCALPPVSFWLDAETGAAFTGYNDVQIPADTGTRFSLADDLEPDPVWFYRLQAGADIGRHSAFVLYAPLLVESTGTSSESIVFNGESFTADENLTGTFKFNSYRFTYAYSFVQQPQFLLAAGITGKIRDAYIKLEENESGKSKKRTDLGVVPLIHLKVQWFISPQFSLLLEGDGLAVPQGRAEDFLLAGVYAPRPDMELRLGYRILEGGSDGGGSVYTFSMFHYATMGIRWKF
ncbi:MAG: hypothetical protein U5P10_01470 [Spirochaetia bacterium]|nr:hypothetical protein [Spirochaetia bacterium]